MPTEVPMKPESAPAMPRLRAVRGGCRPEMLSPTASRIRIEKSTVMLSPATSESSSAPASAPGTWQTIGHRICRHT